MIQDKRSYLGTLLRRGEYECGRRLRVVVVAESEVGHEELVRAGVLDLEVLVVEGGGAEDGVAAAAVWVEGQ
eukprot:6189274-Pleurochrysis_carterae.AAC.1